MAVQMMASSMSGVRVPRKSMSARPVRMAPRKVTKADYIGSPENVLMVASTTAFLVAGRFGLAPSTTKKATAGLKLVPQNPGLVSGDPSGYTFADVFAAGSLGHIVGIGMILGLKATGKM